MAANWAVWQAWGEQRDDVCDPQGVHVLDEDCKHACSNEANGGNIVVLQRGPRKFKRCNIFFCPNSTEVSKKAAVIQKGEV